MPVPTSEEEALTGLPRIMKSAERHELDFRFAGVGASGSAEWLLESPLGGDAIPIRFGPDGIQLLPLPPDVLRALDMTEADLIERVHELPPWEQLDLDLKVDAEVERLRVRETAKQRYAAEQRGSLTLPAPVPLPDFLAVEDDPIRYRVEGLFPVGARVMLSAQYKTGKSTFDENLIRSLADGEPFLGSYLVAPLEHITLIDDELDERMLRRWLRDQGIQNADRVHVVPLRGKVSTFDLLSADVRSAWAQRLHGTQLVVFDCLRPVLDVLGLDENHDAGRFLVSFDEMLGEAEIPEAVIVHHMGHANERSRGDSRLQDWPDVLWKLVRENDDPASPRYFSAFGRDVDVRESRLHYDPDTRRLTLGGGSRKDAKVDAALESVLAVLAAEREPLSGRQIEERLADSHSREEVRSALKSVPYVRGPRNAHLYSIRREEEQ